MKLLSHDDLKPFGIPFTRTHLYRLEAAGKFPKKIKIGGNTIRYREDEVLAYIEARCADRVQAA